MCAHLYLEHCHCKEQFNDLRRVPALDAVEPRLDNCEKIDERMRGSSHSCAWYLPYHKSLTSLLHAQRLLRLSCVPHAAIRIVLNE